MPRYIDAERKVNAQYYDEMHEEWLWKETSIDDVLAAILDSEVPTADVQEVKHGKWEKMWHSYFKQEVPCCLVCGHFSAMRWNFCPNCGADMREEGGDENIEAR